MTWWALWTCWLNWSLSRLVNANSSCRLASPSLKALKTQVVQVKLIQARSRLGCCKVRLVSLLVRLVSLVRRTEG